MGETKKAALRVDFDRSLTEGERLWRPEKIAAVAPSQGRLKVLFRTAVSIYELCIYIN